MENKPMEFMEKQPLLGEGVRFLILALAARIHAVGLNVFLEPLHLYADGFTGYAQLINYFLTEKAGFHFGSINFVGILYFLMNIPGLILSWKRFHKQYVFRMLISIAMTTVALALVPVPKEPILDSIFANCVIAGIVHGTGIGIILRMGGNDGGANIISMLIAQKINNIGVGALSFGISAALYVLLLLLFDVPTVIYSIIFAAVCAVSCDRVHIQNINSQVIIITKEKDISEMEKEILVRLHRGITRWEAKGVYTDDDVRILMVLVSKYEINRLRSIVHQYDPQAFIVANEGVQIDGNFIKKLV